MKRYTQNANRKLTISLGALVLAISLIESGCGLGTSGQTYPGPGPNDNVFPPSKETPGWQQGPYTKEWRMDAAATSLGENIYFAGGVLQNGVATATMEILSTTANVPSWVMSTPLPLYATEGAMASVGGIVYFSGGKTGQNPYNTTVSNTLLAYNPATNSWSVRKSMPDRRSGHALVAMNDLLLVIGGSGDNPAFTWEYNPATDTWRQRASLMTVREKVAGVWLNGQVFAIGGFNVVNPMPLSTVESYDPNTNVWTSRASLPDTVNTSVAAVLNGKIHVFGGIKQRYSPTLNTHYIFDINTSVWSTGTPLPEARGGIAGTSLGYKAYIINGTESGGFITGATDIWVDGN